MPGLDGLRGVAILLVMLHHSVQVVPLPRFEGLADLGWCGVDLFFVLSGFLITGILLDARDEPRYFRNFYMRRVLRIFPLYYGVLAISLLLVLTVPHLRHNLHLHGWLWTYTTNIKVAIDNDYRFIIGRARLDHFWTLAVEEHFYLVWPVLVWGLDRRTLTWVCGGMLIGSPLLRRAIASPGHMVPAYVLTPCRRDALAAGALGAILARDRGLKSLRRPALALALIALALTAALYLRTDHLNRYKVRTAFFGYSFLAAMFAGWVVVGAGLDRRSRAGRILCWWPLLMFGQYSYGLYVFHHILRGYLPKVWLLNHVPGQWLAAFAYFAVLVGLSMLIAVASWHLYEKQFLKLKRFFAYGPGPAPSQVAGFASAPMS